MVILGDSLGGPSDSLGGERPVYWVEIIRPKGLVLQIVSVMTMGL